MKAEHGCELGAEVPAEALTFSWRYGRCSAGLWGGARHAAPRDTGMTLVLLEEAGVALPLQEGGQPRHVQENLCGEAGRQKRETLH